MSNTHCQFFNQAAEYTTQFLTDYRIEHCDVHAQTVNDQDIINEELFIKFTIDNCTFSIEDVWCFPYVLLRDRDSTDAGSILCEYKYDVDNFDLFVTFIENVKQILFDRGLLFDGYVLK